MQKRCFSLLLSLALVFSLVPWASVVPAAAAEEAAPVETLTDLQQALTQVDPEEQESVAGYGLLDLTVSGKVATVTYSAPEDATILVSIYTEDGKQLKASGNAPASAAETTVQVTLTGSMPSYFQAAAFLVRTHDLKPLCDAFRTSRYTKDMQNLLKSTVDSYTKDRVINLDEDKTTNFMVMQKGVVQITASETANVFTTVDRENNRYVIENADKTVTGLQKGSLLVHQLTDGSWLIAKVASIQVDGTTVTIQATTPELNEVFSHVKIENTGTTEQMTIDESTLGEGVTFEGLAAPAPQARTMALRSSAVEDSFFQLDTGTQLPLFKFTLEVEVETEEPGGHTSTTVKDEVTVFVGVEFSNDYYNANGSIVSGKRLDAGLMIKNELEGKITGKALELGKWTWDPIPGVVSVGFEPFIGVELTGKVETEFKAVYTAAVYYDQLAGGYCTTAPEPKVSCETELEGDLFIGLDFNPTAEILGGYLLDADVTAMVGFYFTGERTGTNHGSLAKLPEEEDAEIPTELHSCRECIDGEIFFGVKLGLEIKIAGEDLLRSADVEVFLANKLYDFYYRTSPSVPTLCGLGTCPYRQFRITVEALDDDGYPITDAEVTATRSVADVLDLPLANKLGKTNENGIVTAYISGGWYTFDAGEDRDTENYVHITGPGKVRLDGDFLYYASSEPGSSLAPLLEKITDSGEVVASGKSGDISWTMTAGGFLNISGTGDITETPWAASGVKPRVVVIGEGITGIGDNIFSYSRVFSVTLPSTLQTIGNGAFKYAELKSVMIPDGVTTIGSYAFYGCGTLSNVTFPANLTTMGSHAFQYCYALDNVILPRGITQIENNAFYGCQSLTAISIPNTATRIGNSAFNGCKTLPDIRIPSSVTKIDDYAFSECAFTHVTLPEGALELGYGVFWYCRQLESIELPSQLKTLPGAFFRGCESLPTINLPSTLETIAVQAFFECTSLTSINIPASVTKIENSVFMYCENLTQVTLPATLTYLDHTLFYGCKSLPQISIPATVTQVGESVFVDCESLQQITLPAGITSIPYAMFSGCKNLTAITMLGEITSIGSAAFSGCGFTEFTVPDTVTELSYSTFSKCQQLHTVHLPQSGLTTIPDYCFSECINLSSIEIPESVTQLGTRVFYFCESLPSIRIPDRITEIPEFLFYGCYNLSAVEMSPDVTDIGISAFAYCTSLKTFTVSQAVTKIGENAFYNSALETIIVPEGVTKLGQGAFSECANLKTAVLPESLKTLEMDMFMNCYRLESVNIPSGIKKIPYRAFYICSSLQSIDLPDGLTEIEQATFIGCTRLSSVRMPDSVVTIGADAFRCTNIRSIYIPHGVTSIGDSAFYECKSLTSVTIPRTVQTMGSFAFLYCDSLGSVYFEGDAPYCYVRRWFDSKEGLAVFYPRGNTTWTKDLMESCESNSLFPIISWIPYDPPAAPAAVTVAAAPVATVDSAIGGEYGEETVDGTKYKTASFTGLVPGRSYLLLAVADINASLLDPDNVLYVNQLVADPEGKISHSYLQRTSTDLSFVMLCGGDQQDLRGATVTFPAMPAADQEAPVAPVVELDGKVLTEGVDYRLEGDVTYAKAGTYSLTIRGIYAYTGAIECSYTVSDGFRGDVNGDKVLSTDDAVYLLLHVLFGKETYPIAAGMDLNFDGVGTVNTDDAVYLLLHVLFGAVQYPI